MLNIDNNITTIYHEESNNVLYLDSIPEDILTEYREFYNYIDTISKSWANYRTNPSEARRKELTSNFQTYMMHNKHQRNAEKEMLMDGLFKLWKKDRKKQHIEMLLNMFPWDTDTIHKFVCKFLLVPRPYSYKAIYALLKKSTDPKTLYRKTAKSVIGHCLSPVANFFKRRLLALPKRRLRRAGYSAYMVTDWIEKIITDLRTDKAYSLPQKLKWYKRGFMPWRIPQYGLTEDNYHKFISDRDYCYLHPINHAYTTWINNKLTPRYVLAPFKAHLPEYYFLSSIEGTLIRHFSRLIDCPESYKANYDGFLSLLRDKGDLACKKSSGAHGDGFLKFSYRNGVYFINNKYCHRREIIDFLTRTKNFYIITEYITAHNAISSINPTSLNTVRIMAINEDGVSPVVGDAYLRIGSSASGVVDNVGYGGIFARINLETGYYYEGERLDDHIITSCPTHPDTGVLIEGSIPYWENIIGTIKSICLFMPQLEYLGFDIAITDDGFKILEINVHQDLHRFPNYSQKAKDYLLRKLRKKILRNNMKYKRKW